MQCEFLDQLLTEIDLDLGRIAGTPHRHQQRRGQQPWTRQVAIDGHSKVQRSMWPFQVVAVPPAVKGLLTASLINELRPAQNFRCQVAMKALDFALGLRMVDATVTDPDPEPDQPGFESGDAVLPTGSPGWAIVGQDATGQARA